MRSISQKPSFEELDYIIRFWLETARLDNSPIFEFMKRNDIEKLTVKVKVIDKYTFELVDDEET